MIIECKDESTSSSSDLKGDGGIFGVPDTFPDLVPTPTIYGLSLSDLLEASILIDPR